MSLWCWWPLGLSVLLLLAGPSGADPVAVETEEDAEAELLAVSLFGNATAESDCLIISCLGAGVAASGTGDAHGTHAASVTGDAAGERPVCDFGNITFNQCLMTGAAASGTGDASTQCGRVICPAVAGGNATADCANVFCPAVAATGDGFGSLAAAPLGDADARPFCLGGLPCSGGLAATALGDASCKSPQCLAASAVGDAATCTLSLTCVAASGAGDASGNATASGTGTCDGGACRDVQPDGDAQASSLAASAAGTATCTSTPCISIGAQGAHCTGNPCAAASGDGQARACDDPSGFCIATSLFGDSRGSLAAAGGDSHSSRVALSLFGDAVGQDGAASLTGDAASGTGPSTPCNAQPTDLDDLCVAASGTGDATAGSGQDNSCGWRFRFGSHAGPAAGCVAVSGTGDARTHGGDRSCGVSQGELGQGFGCIAVSGTGDAQNEAGADSCASDRGVGCVAASGTGDAGNDADASSCSRRIDVHIEDGGPAELLDSEVWGGLGCIAVGLDEGIEIGPDDDQRCSGLDVPCVATYALSLLPEGSP